MSVALVRGDAPSMHPCKRLLQPVHQLMQHGIQPKQASAAPSRVAIWATRSSVSFSRTPTRSAGRQPQGRTTLNKERDLQCAGIPAKLPSPAKQRHAHQVHATCSPMACCSEACASRFSADNSSMRCCSASASAAVGKVVGMEQLP